MTGLAKALASGDWLDARLRAYSWIMVALAAASIAILAATSDGLNDYRGRPLGTDFSSFYAAGTYVIEGRPEAPYDFASHHARQKAIFGADTPFYGWLYPPFFLGLAAAFALMPYLLALAVWQGTTFGLYLLTIRAIVLHAPVPPLQGKEEIGRHLWILLAAAFPAVLINLGHGQNGFLTAALVGGALTVLDRRPISAGILFGLLCYKPQFGILIPFALAAGRYARAFMAAAATVLALVAVSWLVFGPETWAAFRGSLAYTQTVALEEGGPGFYKLQSLFAALRAWHAPLPLAYAAQALLAFAVAVTVIVIWRRGGALAPKAAALLSGALLVTPFVLDYDLMVMAPAIAFLAMHGIARGFLPWEKTALAAIFIAPLVTRAVAEHTRLPIGFVALAALFLLAVRRSMAKAA